MYFQEYFYLIIVLGYKNLKSIEDSEKDNYTYRVPYFYYREGVK